MNDWFDWRWGFAAAFPADNGFVSQYVGKMASTYRTRRFIFHLSPLNFNLAHTHILSQEVLNKYFTRYIIMTNKNNRGRYYGYEMSCM